MGNCCLPLRFHRISSAINAKNVTLLLLGLDKSGKTTIAKRLAGEPIDSVVSTVGFSVLNLRQKECKISLYDLGGGPQIRDIWHRYYADAHGVIFVVDASDIDRMDECRQILRNLLRHKQISGKPVLLLANKQDIDGALDEIDVVERLNLEMIVNEQKCPTLVELCSALHFAKKLDIGIDNGYKWLVRSVIRNYPSLNFRVLKDLAKQEEENKVHLVRSRKGDNKGSGGNNGIENHCKDSLTPTKGLFDDKNHVNGVAKSKVNSLPQIPGLVDDPIIKTMPERQSQIQRFYSKEAESAEGSNSTSHSSEFFLFEKFQSDLELLKEVSNHSFKNFLVRPKSSGARLYGIKPDRKRPLRRKLLLKRNKTGPSPLTNPDDSRRSSIRGTVGEVMQESSESSSLLPQNLPFSVNRADAFTNRVFSSQEIKNEHKNGNGSQRGSGKLFKENGNPFMASMQIPVSNGPLNQELKIFWESEFRPKSTPNSRRSSANLENAQRRRHSSTSSKLASNKKPSKTEGIHPLKVNNRQNNPKEILLDVTQLNQNLIL